MASAIDATKPEVGNPTTQSVRDQFATASSEISALQVATAASAEGTTGTVALASVADVNTGTATDTAVTPAGVEGFTGSGNLVEVGTVATGTWEADVVTEAYLPDAAEGAKGIVQLASLAEVNTGTNPLKVVTPDTLADSDLSVDVASIVRVQALSADSTGGSQHEAGGSWTVARASEGLYNVTFPDAASGATAQTVVPGVVSTGVPGARRTIAVTTLTTTTCVIETRTLADALIDTPFSLLRVVG